jgi:hypothetical protein
MNFRYKLYTTKHPEKHQNGHLPGANDHPQSPATDSGSSGSKGVSRI